MHHHGSHYYGLKYINHRHHSGMICLVARRRNQGVPEDSDAVPADEEGAEKYSGSGQPEVEQPPPLLPEPEKVEVKAALPPPPVPPSEDDAQLGPASLDSTSSSSIESLQQSLLGALASLDRGVAATIDDVRRIDNLVRQIEAAGGPVILEQDLDLSPPDTSSVKKSLSLLDGRWRLVYSSGFAGGSLGGRRPGPPSALFPLTLGQVYQDINLASHELDNVVTLVAKLSLAALPGIDARPPTITARLKHTFALEGANTIRITFQDTIVKGSGGIAGWLDNLPQFSTPQLPKSLREGTKGLRGATFDISYIDTRMRITRGDRGELRVFLREEFDSY